MKSSIRNAFSLFLLVITLMGAAQERNTKIIIKITEEVDGETKTFEGEYDSEEEMKADPGYQQFMGSTSSSSEPGDKNHFFTFHFNGDDTLAFTFEEEEFEKQLEKLGDRMAELGMKMESHFDKHRFHYHFDAREEGEHAPTRTEEEEVTGQNKTVKITEIEDETFGKKGKVKEEEQLNLPEFSCYPNPSHGKFRLFFQVPETNKLIISVYNTKGQEIYTRYFERFRGQFSEQVDLSDQEAGLYLLEIHVGQKRLTRKVVID